MSSQSPRAVHRFTVYAGYHQFYLEDERPAGSTGEDGFWTREKCRRMITATDGIVGVGTASYGEVTVDVELWDERPGDGEEEWDHVAEASLVLNGSCLVVRGCPGEEAGRVALGPGVYRVRVRAGGLDTVGDAEVGEDYYRVAVYPGEYAGPHVVKQWESAPI